MPVNYQKIEDDYFQSNIPVPYVGIVRGFMDEYDLHPTYNTESIRYPGDSVVFSKDNVSLRIDVISRGISDPNMGDMSESIGNNYVVSVVELGENGETIETQVELSTSDYHDDVNSHVAFSSTKKDSEGNIIGYACGPDSISNGLVSQFGMANLGYDYEYAISYWNKDTLAQLEYMGEPVRPTMIGFFPSRNVAEPDGFETFDFSSLPNNLRSTMKKMDSKTR